MMNRRGRDGSVYWRCTRSRNSHCNGTITTDIDDRLVFIKDTHNHPRDDSAIVAKKIVNHLKTTTQDNIRPVLQLYLEEIQKVAALPNADEVAANLPTFSAVKSALYRQRRKLIPALQTQEGGWEGTPKCLRTSAHLQDRAGCNISEACSTGCWCSPSITGAVDHRKKQEHSRVKNSVFKQHH